MLARAFAPAQYQLALALRLLQRPAAPAPEQRGSDDLVTEVLCWALQTMQRQRQQETELLLQVPCRWLFIPPPPCCRRRRAAAVAAAAAAALNHWVCLQGFAGPAAAPAAAL